MLTAPLCYPEYYGLPRTAFMAIVYVSATVSVLAFFYMLRLRLKARGIGLLEFLKIIFINYRRWPGLLYDFITHRKLLSRRSASGAAHAVLMYSLLLSLIGTLLVAASQYSEIITGTPIFCGSLYLFYTFVMGVTAWALFISSVAAAGYAYRRREIVQRSSLKADIVYLASFFLLSITGAMIESYRINALYGTSLGYLAFNAYLLRGLRLSWDVYAAIYIFHLELAFALIAFIPMTSIFHPLIAAANYLHEKRPTGELTKPFDLMSVMQTGSFDVQVGINRTSDIKGFYALELEACQNCYRCQDVCPAYLAGRPLSPTTLISSLQREINRDAPIWDFISEDTIWSCTTCGACVKACPVYIRHTDYIVDARRALVMNMKLDERKNALLLSMSSYDNSFGVSNDNRNSWLSQAGLKKASETGIVENLLWVGCMGSFDPEARDIVKNFVEILRKAGVIDSYAYLGEEETCCGDPARRLGEESKFQDLAIKNIEIFKKYGVKTIVTICPHGYNTFKNEYSKIDKSFSNVKVKHYVEVIEELIDAGLIKPEASQEVFVIHDPCYLSRHNEVVEPQRRILRSFAELREPIRSGRNTFCCGAGGSNYWYEVPEKKKISHIRFRELQDTGASSIVVLCPFCNAMLNDASAVLSDGKIKVKDIAEAVNENIK
ncbi:MAG: (Fe-S)-binding protein [Nitrososphaeria archaeon]